MKPIDADKMIINLKNPDLFNVTPRILEIISEQPTVKPSVNPLNILESLLYSLKSKHMAEDMWEPVSPEERKKYCERILRRLSGDGGKKMNKNLFWQYHEGSDSYDLYFNAFGDENIIAGIADTGDGWEYGSTLLGVDNDFLDADNLEDAQSEMLDLIEQHYQDEINYYEELLSQFKEAREENNNEH